MDVSSPRHSEVPLWYAELTAQERVHGGLNLTAVAVRTLEVLPLDVREPGTVPQARFVLGRMRMSDSHSPVARKPVLARQASANLAE